MAWARLKFVVELSLLASHAHCLLVLLSSLCASHVIGTIWPHTRTHSPCMQGLEYTLASYFPVTHAWRASPFIVMSHRYGFYRGGFHLTLTTALVSPGANESCAMSEILD